MLAKWSMDYTRAPCGSELHSRGAQGSWESHAVTSRIPPDLVIQTTRICMQVQPVRRFNKSPNQKSRKALFIVFLTKKKQTKKTPHMPKLLSVRR